MDKAEFAKRVHEATENAGLAFWAEIAKAFPEAKGGDFPPESEHAWWMSMEEAVRVWLSWNLPSVQGEGQQLGQSHRGRLSTMGIASAKVGRWIRVDGTSEDVLPEKGKRFSLAELQKMVGGYVERLKLPGRAVMIVNEDGFPRGLPENPVASQIAGRSIVGDVVVLPSGMGW
jgi:hypothetical protein